MTAPRERSRHPRAGQIALPRGARAPELGEGLPALHTPYKEGLNRTAMVSWEAAGGLYSKVPLAVDTKAHRGQRIHPNH